MSTYNCHVASNGVLAPNPTQVVLGDPLLSEQELRLKEIIRMLYDITGIVPSPSPVLQINMEDISEMCWEPRPRERTKIETEDENVSDKRAHDTASQSRDRSGDSPPLSCHHFLLFFLVILSTWHNNGWQNTQTNLHTNKPTLTFPSDDSNIILKLVR